jgi:hypothetical protein
MTPTESDADRTASELFGPVGTLAPGFPEPCWRVIPAPRVPREGPARGAPARFPRVAHSGANHAASNTPTAMPTMKTTTAIIGRSGVIIPSSSSVMAGTVARGGHNNFPSTTAEGSSVQHQPRLGERNQKVKQSETRRYFQSSYFDRQTIWDLHCHRGHLGRTRPRNREGSLMALPELTMVMTQDEAGKRYCPVSMAGDRSRCEGSGCHGWRWLPGQRDARVAKGFCGMPPAVSVVAGAARRAGTAVPF